jgi:ElaB/YqjD/DUF883 family membrane-anchored ribosome-binding protein
MTSDTTSTGEFDDLAEQLARLREQVEALMIARVRSMSADATTCSVSTALCDLVKAVKRDAETASGQIHEQPLLALLIAAGTGFVLGRMRC